jgi:hypothetical protein
MLGGGEQLMLWCSTVATEYVGEATPVSGFDFWEQVRLRELVGAGGDWHAMCARLQIYRGADGRLVMSRCKVVAPGVASGLERSDAGRFCPAAELVIVGPHR